MLQKRSWMQRGEKKLCDFRILLLLVVCWLSRVVGQLQAWRLDDVFLQLLGLLFSPTACSHAALLEA
jgi:hypothetical protein